MLVCSRCGALIRQGSPSCPICQLPAPQPMASPFDLAFAAPVERRPSTTTVIVGAACGLLVVVAAILGLHARMNPPARGPALGGGLPVPSATGVLSANPAAALPFSGPSALRVSGSSLDPGRAMAVTRSWFVARDAARVANDDLALATLETGAALAVDQGFTRQIQCGCEQPKHAHRVVQAWVVVPTRPVRSFLAQIVAASTDNADLGVYTVVLVPSGGTWKAAVITFEAQYTQPYAGVADHRHAAPTPMAGANELGQLGGYLFAWRVTGSSPPAPPRWTGIASSVGQGAASVGQDRANPQTQVRAHFSVPVPAGRTYGFAVEGGSLVCGSMSNTALDWVPGQLLYQDPSRHNWGASLPPGEYPSLVQTFQEQVCVVNHHDGSRELTAYYGTQTSIRP